jgi:hypothetical protein
MNLRRPGHQPESQAPADIDWREAGTAMERDSHLEAEADVLILPHDLTGRSCRHAPTTGSVVRVAFCADRIVKNRRDPFDTRNHVFSTSAVASHGNLGGSGRRK